MAAGLSSEKAPHLNREKGKAEFTPITKMIQISCKKPLPNLFGVIIFPQRPRLGTTDYYEDWGEYHQRDAL
jgi:hypothetical protein